MRNCSSGSRGRALPLVVLSFLGVFAANIVVPREARADATGMSSRADLGAVLHEGLKLMDRSPRDAVSRREGRERDEDDRAAASRRDGERTSGAPLVLLPQRRELLIHADRAGASGLQAPARPLWELGVRPAVIARDWSGSLGLVGDELPTDTLRLSSTSRMALGRLMLGRGAIAPFVHGGVGEWRYEPALQAFRGTNREYAAQATAGLFVRLAHDVKIAWEAEYTVLVRDRREPQNHPNPYLTSTRLVLATRW